MFARTTPAAAAPDASFVTRSWQTTDGLPQSTVTALARTPDGYLWVGTNGGLARFDGVRFVQYGLADGLRSLNVRALVADDEGGLWVATLGGGLSRVRRDGTITTLTTAQGLAHDEVTAIARADGGGLWVATAQGLQRWTPGGGFLRVGEAEGVSGTIMAMAVTAEGLWASEQGHGLFLCRRDGRCERIEEPVERTKQRALFASAFLVDAAGDLWVSMGNGVVLRRRAGHWTELNKAEGVPFSVITSFAEAPDGAVWAGTNEAGVHCFRDGRFVPVPGAGPTVRALWADPDGIVWAGVEGGGLVRFTRARVTAYRVGENDRQGRVNGLAEAPDGQLWVTTFGRGLLHGPPDRLQPVAGFDRAKPLRAALRMSDGTLYVSGYRQLARRDPATGAVRSWAIAEDPTTLCEGADGALWVGTNAGHLKRLVGDAFAAVPDGAFGYPVTGIARGPGAALWVATRGAGLFRWDAGQTQRWTAADGLPTDLLQALYADPDGTLWIGTAGGGIAWLDGGAGRACAVGPRQGLGDGVVSQILDDGRGHLWVGGLRGVRRLSKAELRAVADAKTSAAIHPLVLDEADGMTTAECTAGFAPAGLLARSGIMYFSTQRDVVAIDPVAFNPAPHPPPVLIESVRCDGRAVTPDAGGDLVLPPGSKELEIRYTGFDGAKPEQLRFRHRLHRDEDWHYVDVAGARDVRYSALRPGAYQFELSAAKADGRWLDPGARLAITVQPYVWQTTGFRAATALGLFAAGVGLVAVVIRRKERLHRVQLAHQRALADAEREIAVQRDELTHLSRVTTLGVLSGSMAHELSQPLTAILSNAQAALSYLANGPADLGEVREILQDIVDDDQRAAEVIRRLRLLFKKGEGVYQRLAPGEVVRDVLRLMQRDLAKHGVVVREEIADDLPAIYGDRVQLQQVLINLVVNACDAMVAVQPADRQLTIQAEVTSDPDAVRLLVRDNGPGVPPERLHQVFEPFVTTKAHGLGLGLAVCRTIVTAHGGRLFAEHANGGGATFVLELRPAVSDAVTAA